MESYFFFAYFVTETVMIFTLKTNTKKYICLLVWVCVCVSVYSCAHIVCIHFVQIQRYLLPKSRLQIMVSKIKAQAWLRYLLFPKAKKNGLCKEYYLESPAHILAHTRTHTYTPIQSLQVIVVIFFLYSHTWPNYAIYKIKPFYATLYGSVAMVIKQCIAALSMQQHWPNAAAACDCAYVQNGYVAK